MISAPMPPMQKPREAAPKLPVFVTLPRTKGHGDVVIGAHNIASLEASRSAPHYETVVFMRGTHAHARFIDLPLAAVLSTVEAAIDRAADQWRGMA